MSRIIKSDDVAQVLIGIAEVADVVDAHDDFASGRTLERASWGWIERGGAAGVDHAGEPVGHAVGSFVLTRDLQAHLGIDIPEVWLTAIRVPDRQQYEELKRTRPDFSVQGKAKRTEKR